MEIIMRKSIIAVVIVSSFLGAFLARAEEGSFSRQVFSEVEKLKKVTPINKEKPVIYLPQNRSGIRHTLKSQRGLEHRLSRQDLMILERPGRLRSP